MCDGGVEEVPIKGIVAKDALEARSAEASSGSADVSADCAWIRAIRGVVNPTVFGGEAEFEIHGDHSSQLGVDWWVDGGIEVFGSQFANDRASIALIVENREVVIEDVVALDDPVLFPGEVDRVIEQRRVAVLIDSSLRSGIISVRSGFLDISPAGGFGHDRFVDFIGSSQVVPACGCDREGSAIEHVLVDPVGEEHTEFFILTQSLERGTSATAVVVSIPGKLIEGDFLVPDLKAKLAVSAVYVSGSVAVVVGPVFRVSEKVEEHVVSVVFDVDEIFDGLVGGVVGSGSVCQT